jgi:hypothetical protein
MLRKEAKINQLICEMDNTKGQNAILERIDTKITPTGRD